MDNLLMIVADVGVTHASVNNENNQTLDSFTIIVLSCVLLAAVLTVILTFMTIIRGRFPVNLFIALLAHPLSLFIDATNEVEVDENRMSDEFASVLNQM
ncbi:unnamed protein product [Heterobilharzia americana]|nr:unnamed protein product [Heterobilharzia americana]